MEVIELICKSAVNYTNETSVDYSIDHIIVELTDFQKFLRETTLNYRRSSNKIDRNSSISILFLICRLIIFKDDGEPSAFKDEANDSEYHTPSTNISTKHLSQKMKEMCSTVRHRSPFQLRRSIIPDLFDSPSNGANSPSLNEQFTTAVDDIESFGDIWRQELENALFDYSLTHFYPEVHYMVASTLKVMLSISNIGKGIIFFKKNLFFRWTHCRMIV